MITNKSALPGDLNSLKITINDVDITSFVDATYLFQDILAPTWTVQLYIMDNNNIMTQCPIKKGSKIKIEVETKFNSKTDAKKEYNFIVFNITDRKFINTKQYSYTVNGLTEDAIKDKGKRISKAYKNKSPSDIVEDIIKEELGSKIEEKDSCDNTISHIVNNITPFTSAYQMAKFGVVEKAADLLFYQSDEKKYKLKSIEKLYKEEGSLKFKLKPSHIRDEKGNINEDMTLSITKHDIQHYDMMSNINSGMQASKVVSFDFISKQWSEEKFKLGDDVKEDKGSNQYEGDEDLFENENMHVSFMPKHPGMHDDETMFDSQKDWMGSRKSSLMKLENDKLIIQCPYGAKAWEYLGKTCEVELPMNQDNDDLYTEFSGKFLIIAICHILTKTASSVNYELVKKRMEKKKT